MFITCQIVFFSWISSVGFWPCVTEGQNHFVNDSTVYFIHKSDSVFSKFTLLRSDHPNETYQFLNSAFVYLSHTDNKLYQAKVQCHLGILISDKGDEEGALPYFKESLRIFTELGDQNGICVSKKWLGATLNGIGEAQSGMNFLMEALSIANEIKSHREMSCIYNDIGIVFLHQGHYEQARAYFSKSIQMEQDPFLKVVSLGNLAMVYEHANQMDKYFDLCMERLAICETCEVKSCPLRTKTDLARYHLLNKNGEQAFKELEEVLSAIRDLGLKQDELATINLMGLFYLDEREYEKAIQCFDEVLEIALKINYTHLYKIYANLSIAYEGAGQYKKSLEYLILESEQKDSLFNIEKDRLIEDMLAKYETEKKVAEIGLLKQEQKIQNLLLETQQAELDREKLAKDLAARERKFEVSRMKIAYDLQQAKLERANVVKEKKEQEVALLQKEKELKDVLVDNQKSKIDEQRMIRNFLLMLSLIIMIAVIVVVLVYQQKIRNQNLLAAQKEELNKQKTLDLIREHEIQTIHATIAGAEIEKKRISSELHDGIAGTLAGIKMNLAKIGAESNNPKLEGLIKNLDDTYHEVRMISHHLSPPRIQNTSFTHLISKYVADIGGANFFQVDLILHPENDLNKLHDRYKVEIYRIVQELLANATKHAQAKQVDVQVIKYEDRMSLIVEDDGIGFDRNKVKNGFGLSSITSRVQLLRGQLDIDSIPGRGSIININIPVG